MSREPQDATAAVGGTPIVELRRLAMGLPGSVVANVEMRNPPESVKDRLGVALIEDAERRGVLRPGMTLVEATRRQHGDRPGFRGGDPRLPAHPYDAVDDG